MDDLHGIDTDLRSIRLDASDGPRLQPLSLDKMFSRAYEWGKRNRALAGPNIIRPPSPPRKRPIHPLPRPLEVEFEHPREMAVLCRVSKSFGRLVRKRLYGHVWVRPWEENCHFKLALLFDTLSKHPELCRLIKRLDVRFFPLAARGGERYDLDDQVRIAVSNMEHLEHLVWTRDKSLHPALLEAISRLPHLRSLEVSGHSYRYYNPRLIGQLNRLEDLRIVMPDSDIRDCLLPVLRELDSRPQVGLKGLSLICRNSPLIDDARLRILSPHLRKLHHLALRGCSRVTKSGLFHILQEAEDLEDISIDDLPNSGILDMSTAPEMPHLHTYSLSITAPHRTPLYLTTDDLPRLPSLRHLSSFHITLSGALGHLPQGGIEHLTAQTDFSQLRKLSTLSLVLSALQLTALVAAAPNLEELYISTNSRLTLPDCTALGDLSIRIFHVTTPEKWGPMPDDLAELARRMKRVEQIGTGNRVYEVFRKEGGEVELARWGRTIVPGYFQIWRG